MPQIELKIKQAGPIFPKENCQYERFDPHSFANPSYFGVISMVCSPSVLGVMREMTSRSLSHSEVQVPSASLTVRFHPSG